MCVFIVYIIKSDDFPFQIYAPAETVHGPRLGPYIPRAGGQDDGSSGKVPQIIAIVPIVYNTYLLSLLCPLSIMVWSCHSAIAVVTVSIPPAALPGADGRRDLSIPYLRLRARTEEE